VTRFLAAWAFAVVAALSVASIAQAQCLTPPGDLNQNGFVEIADIQCAILVVLGNPSPSCLQVPAGAVNVNCDEASNVSDVLILVSYAAGASLASSLDADGDQCPDACEVTDAHDEAPIVFVGKSQSTSYVLKPVGKRMPVSGTSTSATYELSPATTGDSE
jgi:hypothetical protein